MNELLIINKFSQLASKMAMQIQAELGNGWEVIKIKCWSNSWAEIDIEARLPWREKPEEVCAQGGNLGQAVLEAKRITSIDPDYYARHRYEPGVTIESMIAAQ